MAAFDSLAFNTDAFSTEAFDLDSEAEENNALSELRARRLYRNTRDALQ